MLSVGEVAGQPAVLQGDARVDEGRGSTVVVHKERLEDGKERIDTAEHVRDTGSLMLVIILLSRRTVWKV